MKLRSWILASFLLASVSAARATPIYGDVNGDGVITYRDAIILLRVAGGLRADSDAVRRTGDVWPLRDYNGGSFGDGKISLGDALRVFRKAAGLSSTAWPAEPSGYLMEAGNTFVLRRYDATGGAVTGPDLDVPDATAAVSGPITETIGPAQFSNVFVVRGSAGDEQHFVQVLDPLGAPAALLATQLVFGGNTTTFDPPLVLVQYPFRDGARWNGLTTATDQASGVQLPATYTGTTQGPDTITTADFMHAFDNAWKISLTYTTPEPGPSGTEFYWFVPFVGPVQHGYTRTLFGQTTTIVPDYRLVSANIHGVLYP